MRRMGQKRMTIELQAPPRRSRQPRCHGLQLAPDGRTLDYATIPGRAHRDHLAPARRRRGLGLRDVQTSQGFARDIFVRSAGRICHERTRDLGRSIARRWRGPCARSGRRWSRRSSRPRSVSWCSARRSAGGSGGRGVSYGAFIVPGLILLTDADASIANTSFGIYGSRNSWARSTSSVPRRCVVSRGSSSAMSGGGDQVAGDPGLIIFPTLPISSYCRPAGQTSAGVLGFPRSPASASSLFRLRDRHLGQGFQRATCAHPDTRRLAAGVHGRGVLLDLVPRLGRRSRSSARSSIWSQASAGRSSAWPVSASTSALAIILFTLACLGVLVDLPHRPESGLTHGRSCHCHAPAQDPHRLCGADRRRQPSTPPFYTIQSLLPTRLSVSPELSLTFTQIGCCISPSGRRPRCCSRPWASPPTTTALPAAGGRHGLPAWGLLICRRLAAIRCWP